MDVAAWLQGLGLGPGDVVMVTRLDRLARSTRDLLNTLVAITGKESRVSIPRRRMGRHDDGARAFDADRALPRGNDPFHHYLK